jgi:hypothetical protein
MGLEEITPDRVQLVNAAGAVVAGEGPRHSEYPDPHRDHGSAGVADK